MTRARRLGLGLMPALALLLAGVAAGEPPGTRGLRALVAGTEVPASIGYRIVVDDEVGGAPAARITLTRAQAIVGADVRIVVHPGDAPVFTGEVVGLEPCADRSRPVVVRAFNRLHRLTQGRKTRTFETKTDAEIVATIAADHALVPAVFTGLRERHDVVVQHDQTDLEFLLERAARIEFEVFVDDQTLYFQPRDPATVALGPLRVRPDAQLRAFHPRLSSSDAG